MASVRARVAEDLETVEGRILGGMPDFVSYREAVAQRKVLIAVLQFIKDATPEDEDEEPDT